MQTSFNNSALAITNGYKLVDPRRTTVRSWLSTITSLCQRAKDIVPSYAIGRLLLDADDGIRQLHAGELRFKPDLSGARQHPRADLPASSCTVTPSAEDAPVAVKPDTPDQLSVAIEVKFLIPVLICGFDDGGFPHDRRPVLTVAEKEKDDTQALIRRIHDAVASEIRQHAAGVARQRSVTLHDIQAAGRLERDYWETHWIVKKANSASPTASEHAKGSNYVWIPVEVCSPKQNWNDRDGLTTSLRNLTAVLYALTQNHRVTVNYTCDVHVHVGRADGAHLSLRTLKRLATMLWLCEDTIRSVRDPTSPNYRNVFTWGAEMTGHSRLARLVAPETVDHESARPHHASSEESPWIDALQQHIPAIRAIWNAGSHLELGWLLSGPTAQYRRLGFNFSSLGEEDARARSGPKTIEFRVLEGTLDADIITAWVSACWKLVEVAGASAKDGRFGKVIETCFADGGHDGDEQYAVRRGRGPDGSVTGDHVRGTSGERRRLRALAVDGLGIGREMYDAFTAALSAAQGT